MVLLSGAELRQAIERVTCDARVSCAVAFWGEGGDRLLLNPERRELRVICNLKMGGTNPTVVERLIRSGVDVRQCNILHAKVYIGEREAVITSANASMNGLGLEGIDQAGWIEAGMVMPANAAIPWFENLWSASRPITSADLAAALILFRLRRADAPSNQVPAPPPLAGEHELISGIPTGAVSEAPGSFQGKSLREAASMVLARRGLPMSVPEITEELQQGGVTTAAKSLAASVSDALRDSERHGHFVRTGRGRGRVKWALASWPEFAELAVQAAKPKAQRVASGRSDHHADRTRAGLEAAKARGARLGRRVTKMTPERIAAAEKLVAQKLSNVRIAQELGISKSRLYRWLEQRKEAATVTPSSSPQ